MVIEYEVVSEHDVPTLKQKVNELLDKGWQPFHGLEVSTPVVNDVVAPLYTQVLIKGAPQCV